MVLRHLDKVICHHRLVKEVLWSLDLVPALLLDVAGLAVGVDTNHQVLLLIGVDPGRVDGILKQLKTVVDRVERIEVAA